MAKRPFFCVHVPLSPNEALVDVMMAEFEWFPGLSKSQKVKSIESLHSQIKKARPCSVLEVSTKSTSDLGIKLSAFNLGFTHPKKKTFISVESAFQGSKVFSTIGPFHDLYTKTSGEAKEFYKNKNLTEVIHFDFFGQMWPATPKTFFYDWLYLNSLYRNKEMADAVLEYDCFTDIEFNPKRSLNCQAYSAALFTSLSKQGILSEVLASKEAYTSYFKDSIDWITRTEFNKYH